VNRGAVVRAVLHPGVAMASAIAAFVFFLICGDPWRLGVFVGLLCLVECCYGMTVPLLRTMMVFVPAGVIMALSTAWITGDMASAGMIVLRFATLWLSATPLVCAPELAFVRMLNQMRAPRTVALIILIALRSMHLLAAQMHMVYTAWRTVPRGRGHGVRLVRIAVPLMNRVMVISTCMAVSVEMRCFSLDSRGPASVYHPVALHGRDVAFLVLLALAMVVAVTLPWVRHG
jgi:hypothetical protein